jgi:Xaa-Pro dipeptidase
MNLDLAALHRNHVAAIFRAYQAILQADNLDAVVLHSGTLRARTRFDDQSWPLRPTPEFQHWLPLAVADSALVVGCDNLPHLILRREQNFWERPTDFALDFWKPQFEIREVMSDEALRAELPSGRVALIAEQPAWGIENLNPPSLVRALDRLRVHKTPYEIACIEEANRLASIGHRAVADAFRAGDASELDLHLLFLRATRQDDAETPYKNIVALGANAATLHHIHYVKDVRARGAESLLLDAGASFAGYCSDITRTYVKGSGAAASTFGELVARVEGLQARLCAEATLGLPYERLHERSHEEVGKALVDLGVAQSSVEEAVASGVTRAFYPHGLGHSLGLVCHDVGCAEVKPKAENPFLRNTSVISENQVFTIEPGVYFIDMLLGPLRASAARVDWKLVDALAPFGGVRIEDDVRVTAGGVDNLTRKHLP